MTVACEWCGTAIVQSQYGMWGRAKGDPTTAYACDVSEDNHHDPGVTRAAHDEGEVCPCVVDHRPPVLELNVHHIQPLYLGGEDVPGNRVTICPNAHANVHELLRLLIKADGAMSYRQAQDMQTRPVSRYAYDLAVEGYRRWLTA